VQNVHMQAARCKSVNVVNRVVKQSNLMHSQSTIYFVSRGSITLQQTAPYKGTTHYASVRVCSS